MLPLGGSRKGALRNALNLFLVMTLCGIWHGAGFGFLLWGMLHGIYLIIERFLKPKLPKTPNLIKGVWIFIVVSTLWIPFRLDSFENMEQLFLSFYTDNLFVPLTTTSFALFFGFLFLILLEQRYSTYAQRFIQKSSHTSLVFATIPSIVIILASLLFAPPGIPNFIYFAF